MADQKPSVDFVPDGPCIVMNLQNLKNSKGESLQAGAGIGLCRCGGSKNKPYCDSTHSRIGFSDENTCTVLDKKDDYKIGNVTVHDNRKTCSHASFCSSALPKNFDFAKKPWISLEGAEKEKLLETIKSCPSGALNYSVGGTEHKDNYEEPSIFVSKDGPYHFKGEFDIWVDMPWAGGASRQRFALCRCGASKNKPFCDGSHKEVGFRDERN